MSDFQGEKILVVEDDPDMARLVEFSFELVGAQVFTALDGGDALQQFQVRQPDLVLLDLMLPDMDGRSVCRQIREISDVAIIMLSALASERDVVDGLDCGADDYVTKPFSIDVLFARARAILRRRELGVQMREQERPPAPPNN